MRRYGTWIPRRPRQWPRRQPSRWLVYHHGVWIRPLPVVAFAAAFAVAAPAADRLPNPGGDWTRPRQPGPTYIAPAWHLDAEEQLRFYTGMSFFRLPWVAAPSSTTARDGLGPLFNSHSCEGCHKNGGRGRSLLDDPNSLATVVRISVPVESLQLGSARGHPSHENNPQPGSARGADLFKAHKRYGWQLQTRSILRNGGEASLAMEELRVPGPGAGPGDAPLRAPRLRISPHDPGEDPSSWRVSARVAPALLGLGLLEAIPEADVLTLADAADVDNDGISGRPHWRGEGASRSLGRFGWKALHPTVAAQTGAAFRDDIGITNPEFPESPCTDLQTACKAAPDGAPNGGLEIPGSLFDYVVHFVAHLPPPKAGKLSDRVRRGQRTFSNIGCAACHRPSFDTTHGRIWPYTDLLLHDMGDGLADHRPEGRATGREWRTAPLWGIGTAHKVSGHTTLLHDGRARGVAEAILWHDGEAAAAREMFRALSPKDKKGLLAFLDAL